MSERLASFLVLTGSALGFVILWILSIVVVRRDLRRRRLPEIQRRAWTLVTVLLPVFGFALYLFFTLLRGYFTPDPTAGGWLKNETPEALLENRPLAENLHPQAVMEGSGQPSEEPTFDARDFAMLPATGANVYVEEVEKTPRTVHAIYKPLTGNFGLFVSQGPHAGQLFDLTPLPQRIGRGPEVTIPLDADLNVSRTHAEIYEWMGNLRVRDLGSTHGTLVNGVPVTDQLLHPGDHLSVGGSMLILRELL